MAKKTCGTGPGAASSEVDVEFNDAVDIMALRRAAYSLDQILVEMGELDPSKLKEYEDLASP